MRTKRIDDGGNQEREPSGAPSLAFELAFIAGIAIAVVLLYGKPRLADLIVGWLVG